MKLIESIAAEAPSIQALRRDLHAHPELGFEEQRTSDLIASTLTGWGIPVHRGLGRTGVAGIVRNGSSARAVGLDRKSTRLNSSHVSISYAVSCLKKKIILNPPAHFADYADGTM